MNLGVLCHVSVAPHHNNHSVGWSGSSSVPFLLNCHADLASLPSKATRPVPHTPRTLLLAHSLDSFKSPMIACPWLFLSLLQNCSFSLARTAGTWLFPDSSDRFLSCYSVFPDSRNPLPSSNLVLSLPRT